MEINFTTDPYAAWGTLIGTALGQMYNNNAQKRERAKADRIVEDMQNANAIERIANMGTVPAQNGDAGREYANKLIQQQATGIGVDSGINFGGNPNQYMAASMADIKTPSGGLEYSLANVDEDKKYLAKLSPYDQIKANWNPDYTEDNLRTKLRDAGVRESIIDDKVNTAKKDIAKRARDALMPSIMQNLYYGTPVVGEDGKLSFVPPNAMNYAKALVDIQQLGQYDPDAANKLMNGVVAPKDLYNERMYEKHFDENVKVTRENAAQQHKWKVEDANNNFKQRLWLAGQKNEKYTIDNSAYKEAMKRAGEIEAYYQEQKGTNPNFQLPPTMQREWEENQAIMKQYRQERLKRGGNSKPADNSSGGSDEEAVDWNDWNSINAGINQVLADGYTAKDVLELAAEHLGTDHPWYKIIASSFDHEAAKRKKEEEEAAARQRLTETLFPNPNVNTVDQTIAKIAGVGSDIANGRTIWNLAHR